MNRFSTPSAASSLKPRRSCALVGSLALVVSACHGQSPSSPPAADKAASAPDWEALRAVPEVKALMDKTLRNLRFVEGGSFEMGDFGPKHSEEGLPYHRDPDNKPLHRVTLSSFSMSAYKTSYEDHDVYSSVMGKTQVGTYIMRNRLPKAAAGMNWFEAREYCQWLGSLLKLPMDLPTEAQWEYAARNRGQFVLYATDNGKLENGRNIWASDQRSGQSHALDTGTKPPSLPLGQFPPTPLGLYDMVTDGFEWTLDWYDPDYYKTSPEKNPRGPASGTKKVVRSSRGSSGSALAYGDGMTIVRPKFDPLHIGPDISSGKLEVQQVTAMSTAARCVVNSEFPVSKR